MTRNVPNLPTQSGCRQGFGVAFQGFALFFFVFHLSVYKYMPGMVAPSCNPSAEEEGWRGRGQLGFVTRLLSEAASHTYKHNKYKNIQLCFYD